MKFIIFILNFPFTLLGIILLILSVPYKFRFNKNPIAFMFKVKSFWWGIGYLKNARAMTIGYIVLISPKVLKNDLEHELIHINQYEKYPLIFPFLYTYELLKNGYRKNKFEDEAYKLSKSIYKSGKN